MGESLVTLLRDHAAVNMTSLTRQAADEIERLNTLCQDLYHLIMCVEEGCQRCQEGR